jgi:hypothetical protein
MRPPRVVQQVRCTHHPLGTTIAPDEPAAIPLSVRRHHATEHREEAETLPVELQRLAAHLPLPR